jgi:hypothetical protein
MRSFGARQRDKAGIKTVKDIFRNATGLRAAFELSHRRIMVLAKAGKSIFRTSDRLGHGIDTWSEVANAAGHPLDPFRFQRLNLRNRHIQTDADLLLEDMRQFMASVRSDEAEPFKAALLMSVYRQRGSAG